MIAGLALAIALLALVLIVDTLLAVRSLRRSVAALARDIERLSVNAVNADNAVTADDLQAAVAEAVAHATAAERDAEPLAVSRVPQVLRTGPVIKAMALGSGTAHVARRLRGTAGNGGEAANGQRRNGH